MKITPNVAGEHVGEHGLEKYDVELGLMKRKPKGCCGGAAGVIHLAVHLAKMEVKVGKRSVRKT